MAMNAKITVLYDEGALENTPYIGAKGSAYIIDVDGERTLFGAGLRPRYMRSNMNSMGVDADGFDRVIIPDADKDEWGGIDGFLQGRGSPIRIMAPPSVWGEKKLFGSTGMYVGTNCAGKYEREDLEPSWSQISENLFVGVFGNRDFEEAVAVIRAIDGPVVLSCRCMSGMQSIFEAVEERFKRKPVAFIGAIDTGRKNDALCDAVGNYLLEAGCTDLRFNHCTKALGIGRLRTVLGQEGVKDFFVGESAEFKVSA